MTHKDRKQGPVPAAPSVLPLPTRPLVRDDGLASGTEWLQAAAQHLWVRAEGEGPRSAGHLPALAAHLLGTRLDAMRIPEAEAELRIQTDEPDPWLIFDPLSLLRAAHLLLSHAEEVPADLLADLDALIQNLADTAYEADEADDAGR